MARQERAEQTRQRIVEAAASEFAGHGYDGTSLHGIVRTAGVTMGALTFHFRSKSALADAVQESGAAATRAALDATAPATGFQGALETVLALAGALRTTPSVRAAARLTREGHGGWYDCWAPGLRDALERSWCEQRADSGLTPLAVTTLLAHVVLGAEAAASTPEALRPVTGDAPEENLAQALRALGPLLLSRPADTEACGA
ncbi:TetR family transcriptional regulator [Streptomyces longwoodensis]|uniref:TetR family transcriptional regulator n=1 Tax=Streptomyces longwoodensis TaxID=68231 RepID=UPI0036F54771